MIADLNGSSPLYKIGIKIFSFLPRKLKIFLFKGDLFLNGEFPKRSKVSQKWVKDMLEKSNFKIEYEHYYNLFFNYLYKAGFYYLGKPFCVILNFLYPFNILLIKMEKSNFLKKIFRYNDDAYIFAFTKK